MSQIQKMSIQGIRSFGPDDTNRQAITFFNPLTLILGPNGTGKTTVIECLKYITTGDLPPAHKDAAFVHDPKIARESTVNGQVRLQLTDVRGNRYIVQRSLQATQKVKSVSMKTLEGVITFQTKDGRKQSNTTRCVDLNKEMTSLLGVSKPVLENVIFCHQEESNWPLSEGKALKQKFDDIFASTRYVKALECIRKFRTDQVGTVREFQAEIKYLKQNKEKSADIAADLDEVKAKYLASKETVQGIEEKLQPIQEKLEQIGNQEGDIWKLHTKIEGLKIEKNQLEKQQQELRDKIDNEFTGTTDELEQKLRDFEKKVAEREEKLKKLEKKLVSIEQDINSLSQEKGDLLVKQGKLEQEATQHKENTNQRNEKIRSMADAYAIQGFSGNIEDRHVKKFLEVLQKNAEDVIKQAKEKRGEFEEHEKRIQMEIDKLKKTKTELETEHKMKSDTMGKNKEEIKRLNKELSRVDASADRLSSIRDELRSKEHELKEIEKSLNTDEMKQEVTKLQNDRTTMDAKLKQLNNELNRLHAESSTRTQLDMLKKDRITKQDQIRKLKAKNEDSLQHILGHIPPDNLRNDLDDYIRNIGSEIQRENKHIEKLKMELAGKEMERKHMQDQLGKKEKELNGYEEKIFSECESQNFDEGLEKLESKIRTNQQTHGLLIGTKEVFNKYMRTLEKSGDPPCPLCHRPFDNHSEVEELIAEIRNKLKLVPDKLEKVSHDIDEYQGKFNRMQQLKPLRSNIIDLRDTEIPDLKKRQKTVDGRITHLKEEIEEKSDSLEAKESDKAMADSLTRDVYMIDKYQTELRDLDRKIGTQSAKIAGSDSERTVTIVATERDDIQMTLDGVNRQLDHKRQKLSDHGEKLQQVRSDINELVADKLQIETDLQQRQKLEGEKAVLASTLDTLDREIQDASQQITPLQTKIESQMKEKNKVTDRKEKEFDKAKDEFNQIKSSGKEVSSINDQIQQYFSQGRDKELKKCETLMRQMEEDASEKDGEREELTTGITRIRKDLDTQKSREREMSDNMALRKKEEQVVELREKMDTLEEKLGGLDVTKLEREKNKLKREQEKYEQDKHTAVGRQMGLQDQIKQFTKEINSDQFKDADVKYRDKMILLRTTELANADLDKYYKALDRTIMAYHSQKMSEINKIIRELWRNTYRGNDIETIEIRSDADEGESGAIKRRRVYNYRVVMLRGDAALDMRGRCSAGQKVLASLIIRLALAETFCLNCGILALDEPTTNLDRENIESLAYALVEIIKQRAKQKNFQLIVITHDEDFVELLGRADFVEEFYKVKKDNQGFSCLAKAKVEDMQSR